MPDLPELTETDIRRWTGDESFAHGSRYFSDGAVRNPRLVGSTLKSQCEGSQIQPYRVQVTSDGILAEILRQGVVSVSDLPRLQAALWGPVRVAASDKHERDKLPQVYNVFLVELAGSTTGHGRALW